MHKSKVTNFPSQPLSYPRVLPLIERHQVLVNFDGSFVGVKGIVGVIIYSANGKVLEFKTDVFNASSAFKAKIQVGILTVQFVMESNYMYPVFLSDYQVFYAAIAKFLNVVANDLAV
uniref:RNase H type-1 domain-containing protein n=1 Tax=Cannabis sativa TaxID=3483 RepID=A0A803QIC1_CANSA